MIKKLSCALLLITVLFTGCQRPTLKSSPTWVFEGSKQGNIGDLRSMKKEAYGEPINFIEAKNTDHFGILAPVTEIIAKKILQDTAARSNISFTQAEIDRAFSK